MKDQLERIEDKLDKVLAALPDQQCPPKCSLWNHEELEDPKIAKKWLEDNGYDSMAEALKDCEKLKEDCDHTSCTCMPITEHRKEAKPITKEENVIGQPPKDECKHDWDFFSKVRPAGHYCVKCGNPPKAKP